MNAWILREGQALHFLSHRTRCGCEMQRLAFDCVSSFYSYMRTTEVTALMPRFARALGNCSHGRLWVCFVGFALATALFDQRTNGQAGCSVSCTKTTCIFSPDLGNYLVYDPLCEVIVNTKSPLAGSPGVLWAATVSVAAFGPFDCDPGNHLAADAQNNGCTFLGDETNITCYSSCKMGGG